MKAEKIITRTIVNNSVKVLGVNLNTATAEERTYNIGEVDDGKLLKVINTISASDNFTAVKVLEVTTTEKLYGMPESLFLQYAKELPPRKVYETEEKTEEKPSKKSKK